MWDDIKTTIKAGDLVKGYDHPGHRTMMGVGNPLNSNWVGLVLDRDHTQSYAVYFTVLWQDGQIASHPRDELVKIGQEEEQNSNAVSKLKG